MTNSCCGCNKNITPGELACEGCWRATGADPNKVLHWAWVVSSGALRRWLEQPQGPRPASGNEIVRAWLKRRLAKVR